MPLIEFIEEFSVPLTCNPTEESARVTVLLLTVPDRVADAKHDPVIDIVPTSPLPVSEPEKEVVSVPELPLTLEDHIPCQEPERFMVASEASAIGFCIGTSLEIPH